MGCSLEHLDQQIVAGHFGLLVADALPLARSTALRMVLEEHVPEILVPLQVQALGDDAASVRSLSAADHGSLESVGPLRQPLLPVGRSRAEVVEGGEQVRLTLASIPEQHDGTGLAGTGGLDGLEEVERRVGDLEELGGRDFQAPVFDWFVKSTVVPEPSCPELFTQPEFEHVGLVVVLRTRARALCQGSRT